ncbi:hypothetical protein DSO57_1011757 [Entomophthora muscae]|uniref:Uncharacterized protein n=1 Tax=Entomophthora muscae TaxID=34485 RepID=A0ACC2SUX4_9FUNG|nr:hypothetical protein DSO57_1011757 [Entomophthora muscae]
MEGEPTVPLDKVRQKRGIDTSRLLTDEKSRKGSNVAFRGNKAPANAESRSRNPRGKRGSRKPNGSARASENSLNQVPPLKPLHKVKAESKEPSLLESGFKVAIRRLPPNLPENVLLETISPWANAEKYEWFKFIPGKVSDNPSKPRVHSRAYIRFIQQEDASILIRHFNGHKFMDSKGVQDKTSVNFSPFSKTPKAARPDARQGTITEDPEFLSFVESLSADKENTPAQPQTAQVTISEDPKSTPLIEYLRAKKAELNDSRHGSKSSKSPVALLSRNGKSKPVDHPKSAVQESSKGPKDDKKSKRPKPAKPTKEAKPTVDSKVENDESGSARRPRRRLRKRGGAKEEASTPFAPTHILKPPSKGQDPEWPEPGIKHSNSHSVDEPSPKSIKPKPASEPAITAPVRHVFKLTNGCLTPSTGQNNSTDSPSKPPRTRRRRPPPATSKPQAAS